LKIKFHRYKNAEEEWSLKVPMDCTTIEQGRSQLLGFGGAKLKKKIIWRGQKLNFFKKIGIKINFYFFFLWGETFGFGAQAPPSQSLALPLSLSIDVIFISGYAYNFVEIAAVGP
jgi:hypothetical protein